MFEQIISKTKENIGKLHANRITPDMIEHLKVEAYGNQMPISQVSTISSTEARQLTVSPWDKALSSEIEKALRVADIGAGIVNDGENIRVSFPDLTEEKRKEIVKKLHELIEEGRIAVRRKREEELKKIKDLDSKDEADRLKADLQKKVDQANEELSDLSETKEKELLTI